MEVTPLQLRLGRSSYAEINFHPFELLLRYSLYSYSQKPRLCPEGQVSTERVSVVWVSMEVMNVA